MPVRKPDFKQEVQLLLQVLVGLVLKKYNLEESEEYIEWSRLQWREKGSAKWEWLLSLLCTKSPGVGGMRGGCQLSAA